MADYYDELETRDPELREAQHMVALAKQVANAKANAPHFTRLLGHVDPAAVTSRAALAKLPVTRKSDLLALQQAAPPFGGLAAARPGDMAWLFLSPGPIADPGGRGGDWFRFARALFAAGFRPGDIVHNGFSYHFTPAGLMCDAAARHLGCAVFPGGVGQTDAQVQAMAYYRADGFVGTPDFLKIILEKAREVGADIACLKRALVGGGALPPSLRKAIQELGVNVLQSYGTADLGLVAYESEALDGMLVDEGVIVEIVRPGTGDPVAAGEIGEVVVTAMNADYPLIRFATGDLSALLAGQSACGRTAPRIRGWMGRADQTTKVRGMFVHPEQVAQVTKAHPAIAKARLIVASEGGLDTMTLRCEVAQSPPGLAEAIDASLQAICRVRGRVELVPLGSLANDGKIIEDARSYA